MGKKAAAAKESDEGNGDFVLPDGSTYVGQYCKAGSDTIMHGQGCLASGPESFQGTFEMGSYKEGRFTSCNGAVYNGGFRDNRYHGVGEYHWPDGRTYRGTWKEGNMHGYGQFLNFSRGVDKAFSGFSYQGEFNSSPVDQEKAKTAFLAEYGGECAGSATAALRDMAERAGPEGPPKEYLLVAANNDADSNEEVAAAEATIPGPFPEADALPQAALQAFATGLAEGAEQPLKVNVLEDETNSSFGGRGLRRPQLRYAGQAVEFVAAGAEAGSLLKVVLLNICPEFDIEQAKWKTVHAEPAPHASH